MITREKKHEYNQRWQNANREKVRKSCREYALAHPDKARERVRKWAQLHPEKRCQNQANRRARENDAKGSHTLAEWQSILKQHPSCAYCGRTDCKLTRDHVVPLSKGGSNYISNIVPACQSCNSRKKDRAADTLSLGPSL